MVGIDYAVPLLQEARRHCVAPFVAGDLRALPFAAALFEGAWAMASLHHLRPTDILKALVEVRRVLKVGGRFLATVKAGVGQETDREGRFFSYYGEDQWRGLVERAGLRIKSLSVDREERAGPEQTIVKVKWLYSLCEAH